MKTAAKECSVCGYPVYDGNDIHERCVKKGSAVVKVDTEMGKLIDLTLKAKYGEDFQWDTFRVTRQTGNVYIVEIDTREMNKEG